MNKLGFVYTIMCAVRYSWTNLQVLPQGLSPPLRHTLSMAKNPLDGVCWEGTFQGKPYYSAKCDIEALIISQDDSLPGVADAVPRLNCELMDSDQNQLERLGLLKESPRDDASIMAARIDFDKRFTKVQVERSNHGGLPKTKVQEVIRNTMKTSTKPARKQEAIHTGMHTMSVGKHEFCG